MNDNVTLSNDYSLHPSEIYNFFFEQTLISRFNYPQKYSDFNSNIYVFYFKF